MIRRSFVRVCGILVVALLSVFRTPLSAQDPRGQALDAISQSRADYADLANSIWSYAELGYQEHRSSALLQSRLDQAGFAVAAGIAGMPTAFVASYGTGYPVIGILAEYDALPGLSQDTVPERRVRTEMDAGHACGHHLFGVASVAAAMAVKEWLDTTERPGTIRVYGTPAEEGGGAKVYMVRAGLFDDVDIVLHWHPSDRNDASPSTTLANRSGKFRFFGHSTHAAGAPERGRSALDAVEAMNHMVNLMREHVPEETRMHYIITRGGFAPNVVPDFAEAYHYARHPDAETVKDLWDRLVQAARGAALGTGTRMEHEIVNGVHSLLPNDTLARLVHANFRAFGGVQYTVADQAFARRISETLDTGRPLNSAAAIEPYGLKLSNGSTDVGDVSWTVPTAGFGAATWVPGTSAHSWQAVAAGGTEIGIKGMLLAAHVLAGTALDLLADPGHVAAARREFDDRRGPDFRYEPLLGDRDPPLEYRK